MGKHVKELVPALAAQGVEVHVLTPRWLGGRHEEHDGAAYVHRVDPPPHSELTDFFSDAQRTNVAPAGAGALPDCSRSGDFDLIHAHDWLVAFAGAALKDEFKIPLLATIHATEHGRNHGYRRQRDITGHPQHRMVADL